MQLRPSLLVALAALCLPAAPALAITLGSVDTFSNGSTEGWSTGLNSPVPPSVVASGGPGGAADSFLQMLATGLPGAGGRLVSFGGPQWSGDYLTAGVNGIALDMNNLGSTDLSIRLVFEAAPLAAITSGAVALRAGSGWTHVVFSLEPDALTGSPAALGGVTRLRLVHQPLASFGPPPEIAATLGIDNVSAEHVSSVPEPSAFALLGAGLAALGWSRRLRRTAP